MANALLSLEGERQRLAVCLLWAVWMNRNKANVGEDSGSIAEITRRATLFACEAIQQEETKINVVCQGRRVKEKWTPPPINVLKINFDGAFRAVQKDGAWGFCIRDHAGNGVLAGSGRLTAVHDALSAEGEACLAALKAAMELGISRVALETDSTNLVKALTSNSFDQAPGGIIFREVRVLLSMHFVLVSLAHVPRGCSMSAHDLAQLGLQRDLDQPVIWTDPLPSFVRTMLNRDRVGPSLGE